MNTATQGVEMNTNHRIVWTNTGTTDTAALEAWNAAESDWESIDGQTIDGAEDEAPYAAAEAILLADNGLTRDQVQIVSGL